MPFKGIREMGPVVKPARILPRELPFRDPAGQVFGAGWSGSGAWRGRGGMEAGLEKRARAMQLDLKGADD